MDELARESIKDICNLLRMSPALFEEIVDRLEPYISKKNTNFRQSILGGIRVAITLRYIWV